VRGQGWTAAKDLRIGDLLRSHDGRWIPVADLCDSGEDVAVYNLRVADYHTYFVGSLEWGFSVWAHNQCTGQLHHAISRKVFNALRNTALAGLYAFRDRRLATRAMTLGDHLGYQRWDRRLDQAIVGWLQRNPNTTVPQFEGFLRRMYNQGKLIRMFSNGL
jgi:hypothetical protein